MPLDPIPEADLRAALQPFRADPDQFEAAVRKRLLVLETKRADDPLADASPWLKSAAAFLPLPLVGGSEVAGSETRSVSITGGFKLVSYLTFPAISLFVLLGASVFSVAKIRDLQRYNLPIPGDEGAVNDALKLWWTRHKWPARLVFAAILASIVFGATWYVFLGYTLSLGFLLYVLSSLAKVGLGDRESIGTSCMMGLMLLGQVAVSAKLIDSDVHFVDQSVTAVVLLGGALALLPTSRIGGRTASAGGPRLARDWRLRFALTALLLVPLSAWLLNPLLWPATPARVKGYVESFDQAPFQSSSWQRWEIPARWAIDERLDPDLARPRRLLDRTLANQPDPFTLGVAFRVGLIPVDQISRLAGYEDGRHSLFDNRYHLDESRPILSLAQEDWIIRASVLNGSLTVQERDYLEKRLHITMSDLNFAKYGTLEEMLRVTQLLAAIGRPVDPDRYRTQVHGWLRKLHISRLGLCEPFGGFKVYSNLFMGSTEATEYAIELMEVYGIPADLDLNQVRSFVRPNPLRIDDKWITATARHRLDQLPGARQPTWTEIIIAERSLVAAVVLVGLCLYATLASPRRR